MYPIIYDSTPLVYKMIDTSKITVGLTDGAEFVTPAKATINADKTITEEVNNYIKDFIESLSTSTAETITYTSAKSVPLTLPQIVFTNADDDSINSIENPLTLKPVVIGTSSGNATIYKAEFGIFSDVPDQKFGMVYQRLSEGTARTDTSKGGFKSQSNIAGKASNYREVDFVFNRELSGIAGNYTLKIYLVNKLFRKVYQVYTKLTTD